MGLKFDKGEADIVVRTKFRCGLNVNGNFYFGSEEKKVIKSDTKNGKNVVQLVWTGDEVEIPSKYLERLDSVVEFVRNIEQPVKKTVDTKLQETQLLVDQDVKQEKAVVVDETEANFNPNKTAKKEAPETEESKEE